MTPKELLGFHANIPRLEARRIRQQIQLSGTRISAEHLRELVLLETEDEAQADRAASEMAAAELRAGQTPL